MERILSYGIHMIPYMLCAFPVIFLYRWLRVRGLHKRGRHTTWRHELAFCVFLLFLAGLASQTVVPRLEFGVGGLAIMGGGKTGLRINLIPFRIFADSLASGTGYFIINFLGNIGMFLPIGFFTALLWERPSFLKSAGAGFFTSLTIELCQLPLDRGTDIDDLWLNTLGAALGYLVFLLCRRIDQRCNTNALNGFTIH